MPDQQNSQNSKPSNGDFKESIARTITKIVLYGTVAFGLLGLMIAVISIFAPTKDIGPAKEIMQILFSTILPLLGTWLGTVLAFYFSKDNFEAANRSVQHLVEKLTSEKKLASIKAKDVMIPLDKLIYKEYTTGTDDSTINLKTDFLDFINGANPTGKKISRIMLLDENKVAKYVLHRSLLEGFIADQFFKRSTQQDVSAATNLFTVTFKDMKEQGNEMVQRVLANGIKWIPEMGSLSDARLLLKNTPECNDVFITKSGSSTEPVMGWITDKTIAENLIVD